MTIWMYSYMQGYLLKYDMVVIPEKKEKHNIQLPLCRHIVYCVIISLCWEPAFYSINKCIQMWCGTLYFGRKNVVFSHRY